MSGRQHSAPRVGRTTTIAGAGVAGLAAVFAVAPPAHAKPADHHQGGASTSGSTAGSQSSPTAKKSAVKKDAVTPTYGLQKYRVGVQIKDGSYVPGHPSTGGSTLKVTETGPNAPTPNSFTCTTVDTTPSDTTDPTYCPGLTEQDAATQRRRIVAETRAAHPNLTTRPTPTGASGTYEAGAGDTVTITQLTAVHGMVKDPATATLSPCEATTGFGSVCLASSDSQSLRLKSTDEIFDDTGLPPVANNDTATVAAGHSVDVGVLHNDTTHGAPVKSVTIASGPAHGSVTVQSGATSPAITYTPKSGFVGTDTFRYTLTTANGSSTATVTVTVTPPPPTAKNDSASTTSGHAVTIAVTDNDDANGGTFTLTRVGVPSHGSVRIDGLQVVYTSKSGFVGTDTFTYTVTTAGGSATATVTVDVSGAGTLADTGIDTLGLVDLAAALMVLGAAGTLAGNRRRRARHVWTG